MSKCPYCHNSIDSHKLDCPIMTIFSKFGTEPKCNCACGPWQPFKDAPKVDLCDILALAKGQSFEVELIHWDSQFDHWSDYFGNKVSPENFTHYATINEPEDT